MNNPIAANSNLTSAPAKPLPPYPPQHQVVQPGIESLMNPRPVFDNTAYAGSGKLKNKVAVITGGDSGHGRAIAAAFAKEGADIVIVYLNEHTDAEETKQVIEQIGRCCLTIAGDVGSESFCKQVVEKTLEQYGKLDIVVNNTAEQHVKKQFGEHYFGANGKDVPYEFLFGLLLNQSLLASLEAGQHDHQWSDALPSAQKRHRIMRWRYFTPKPVSSFAAYHRCRSACLPEQT